MRKLFTALLLSFLFPCPMGAEAEVLLNEILAANRSGIRDEDGDASDWIEVFNASEDAIDLGGWTLSDDPEEPAKWTFPARTINPGGRLLIWASDKNRQGDPLHASFALKQKGESVVLSDPSGRTVDRIDFGPQPEDRSLGRLPDGGDWMEIDSPSPGAPNRLTVLAPPPTFSIESGFFDGPIRLVISSDSSGGSIRFTTDGSRPTQESEIYRDPLPIERTTVIRAKVFPSLGPPGRTGTKTYFLEPMGALPSLSLVVSPEDLWDASRGILANPKQRGDLWEREASIEFFDPSSGGFALNCGVRVHGGISRSFGKNSFRLYFSDGYGADRLDHPLFPERKVASFKRLVLSGGSNDSFGDTREIHNAVWTLLRDALMNEIFEAVGVPGIGQKPVRLFLNGEPWGIYWIKERIDKYFVEDHFGHQDYNLLKHEHRVEAIEGSLDRWNELTRFFRTHPLNLDSNLQELRTRIDLENFIDHHLVQMWSGNVDWPHNNHFQLHPGTESGTWRWIPWDSDTVLGSPYVVFAEYDMYRHLSGRHRLGADWSTLPFRSLIGSEDFRRRLVRRAEELLEGELDNKAVRRRIEGLSDQLRPDIAFETDRWGSSPEEWEKNVEQLARFVRLREKAFREQTRSFEVRTESPIHQGAAGLLRILTEARDRAPASAEIFELAVRQGD